MIEINLLIRDNTDWQFPWVYTDEDDVPYNFTGSTFRLDVKTSVDDVAAVVSLTTANGGIVSVDLPNGAFRVDFADFLLAIGNYVYDLVRISGGVRETLMVGQITVEKGVTGL